MIKRSLLTIIAALSLGTVFAQTTVATVRTPAVSPYTVSIGGEFGTNQALHLAFSFNQLASIGSLKLGARLGSDAFGSGGTTANADLLLQYQALPVTLYFGPGVSYQFAGAPTGGFYAGVVAGATVPIYQAIGLYGEGFYRNHFSGQSGVGARVGLNFSL